jgi:hypothetical protein
MKKLKEKYPITFGKITTQEKIEFLILGWAIGLLLQGLGLL